MQIPADEMLAFIRQHHYSGRTESSFEFSDPVIKKNSVVAELGFKVSKGGLPAIFLNLGGLHNQPYFFIQKAVDNNIDKIKNIQVEALREVIKNVE